jgi:hypothetical protein
VIIRLGDRETLHPHWVHLYRGGDSLEWEGEFFLTVDQADQSYDLLLETMQVDQSTNRLFINGSQIGHLLARPRPDPTSTWVTQRLNVPAELLQAGVNVVSIKMGPRNAARQYTAGRWENMQFRHLRLTPPEIPPAATLSGWEAQPSPSGWGETNRLRPGLDDQLWLTGIRPGQLWQIRADLQASDPPQQDIPLSLENQAGDRTELIFNDILLAAEGTLAATDQGLFWRSQAQPNWQPVIATPRGQAYVLAQSGDQFYAGFEGAGLWQAAAPAGPWQRTVLTGSTVIDLVSIRDHLTGIERLYATTPTEVFVSEGAEWRSFPLPSLSNEAMAEAGESPADKFKARLYATLDGRLLVRHQDRFWLQDEQSPDGWALFGPEALQGKLFSVLNCCGPGTWVGSNKAGIWQLVDGGEWQRLDNGFFDTADVTELLQVNGNYYAAGDLGLFHSTQGRSWQKVSGLPGVITDLLVDPMEPKRWIAGTPAGIYRSQDGGQRWESVSPPWTIWDMALGPQGRFFAGRNNGLVWTDDLGATPINWQISEGLERVYFLRIKPHLAEAQRVWAGTWGNNIGVSQDGGESFEPLHNGLETLSGLDLIWRPTPGRVTLATFEGLYQTDDGGESWVRLPGPLSHQTIYALLQSDDGTIWAGATDGLWRSGDDGASWAQVEAIPQTTVLRLGRIAFPPPASTSTPPFLAQPLQTTVDHGKGLWAGTEGDGLWLSLDNRTTWHFAGLPGRTVYQLFFDPGQSRRLVAATDQGIFSITLGDGFALE